METGELIRILETLPEFRLRILELAWKVVGDDGTPDLERAALFYKEIREAADEAEAYAKGAKEATQCLIKMGLS